MVKISKKEILGITPNHAKKVRQALGVHKIEIIG